MDIEKLYKKINCNCTIFMKTVSTLPLKPLIFCWSKYGYQLEQISDFVNNNGGHSIPSVNSLASTSSNPHFSYGTSSNPPLEPPSLEREQYTHEHINNAQPTQHFQPRSQMEKMMMSQTMVNAVTEIIRLIHIEEPTWIKSSIDDRLVIDQENYEKSFTNISHLKSPSARIESSKEVVVVPMDARNLVDMFFDTVCIL